ncbi:MAG: hypothetical protein Q4G26_12555 [Paracoccus sp. (in: a-proteobacteria)]|nr:hypothetical protein [Paracoccus sp. (in: a-proteobacteria)]
MITPLRAIDWPGGRRIALDLYMNEARLARFSPQDLDGFVPLAQGLAELDARAAQGVCAPNPARLA